MAVAEQTPYKEYVANGVTTSFPLEFDCDDQDHLIVTVNDIEPENGQWSLINGAVVFGSAPADQSKIIIQRNTPLDRNTNYQTTNNSFRPQAVNKDFDRIWWKLQELWVQVSLLWAQIGLLWSGLKNEIKDRIAADLAIRSWVLVLLNNIVDSGLISAIAVTTVDSISDLNNLIAWEGRTVYVKSYYQGLGEGGGTRIYDASRKTENDGFLCINGWVLQIKNNIVTPEQAGAKGDGVTDDYEAFTRLLRGTQIDRSKGLVVQLAKATYVTTKPIEMYGAITLRGSGYGNSIILKKTASKSGITGRTDPFNNPYDYDKDAAVIFASWHGWYGDIHLQDFTIKKEAVNGVDVGYALLMPFIMQSNFTNVQTLGGEYGIWCEDAWMINWNRVKVTAKGGWYIGTGTSHSFHSCWVTDVKQGYSAYRFHSMTYSTMISCGADRVGELGKPANAVYHITGSDITLISCAAEDVHCANILRSDFSWITFISPSFRYGIINNYADANFKGLFNLTNSDSVLKIIGGRLDVTNGENAAVPIYVHDGTLSYDQVLWPGVGFPDDATTFKISYGNDAAILDLKNFQGRVYKKSRLQTQAEVYKTVFKEGVVGNGGNIDFANAISYGGFNYNTGSSGTVGAGFSVGKGDLVLQIASSYNGAQLLKFRTSNADSGALVFSPWLTILNSGNTTKDANGFIKGASPIVNLFANEIELNDEAELQPITFEKLGIGDYLVKGSLGFAQDGWYIETPKDANGNVLVAVVYEQLGNNDISVKTYAKKFDEETGDVVPNLSKPRDIPEGRWITLRLQELPKIEQEIEPVN